MELEFDTTLNKLRSLYQKELQRNKELLEFNKDEEREKLKQRFNNVILMGTTQEKAEINAFRSAHWVKCRNPNHFIYDVISTGFGDAITIKCPICGESKNIEFEG